MRMKEQSNRIRMAYLEMEVDDNIIHQEIINFIWENPNPNDMKIHELADNMGMSPSQLEEHFYMVLTSLVHLKGSQVPDESFDAKQLEKGIQVEMEHTVYPLIAKNIAKVHLQEHPEYYMPYLEEMEEEMEEDLKG